LDKFLLVYLYSSIAIYIIFIHHKLFYRRLELQDSSFVDATSARNFSLSLALWSFNNNWRLFGFFFLLARLKEAELVGGT
jgi:hypothetical protein